MATFCAHYDRGRCRSCSWIERSYDAQIAAKEAKLREALGDWLAGAVPGAQAQAPGMPVWEPSVASSPRAFRNRAKMVVTGTTEAPIIGLTGQGELDAGRELLDCPIHHPRLNELIAALPDYIRR